MKGDVRECLATAIEIEEFPIWLGVCGSIAKSECVFRYRDTEKNVRFEAIMVDLARGAETPRPKA